MQKEHYELISSSIQQEDRTATHIYPLNDTVLKYMKQQAGPGGLHL
jgi:hypothetical protein